jgi:DNA-binding beta-propeller fold protein YncE
MAAVLLGAARPAEPTVYSAPAGARPAGANARRPTDAVLPDGRIAAPVGDSVFVGTNPLAVAITPDGRFAIVANANAAAPPLTAPPSSPRVVAGYSLAVVDTHTMQVVSTYSDPSFAVYGGLAAVADPSGSGQTLVLATDGAHGALRFFGLASDGTLTSLAQVAIAGYPAALSIARGGRTAYVTSELGDEVTAVDLVHRTIDGAAHTGFFPYGVAAFGDRALVANGGLASYQPLARPESTPAFAPAAADPYRSSSLSLVSLDPSGSILAQQPSDAFVRLDPVPDGRENIGGARPTDVVVRNHGRFAYVSLANVDRVATVDLQGEPRVVSGLDLRQFINAPYGTQPGAEALSRDDRRLYVALAGINAIAVLDATQPQMLHRLGLIPTAADPSSLAISPDGRYLYVTAAQGVDGWGELQRIDLRHLPLAAVTLSALRYTRSAALGRVNPVVPALRTLRHSSAIDRIVYIAVGDATYDAIFGDLGKGNGDPALVSAGANVTPNLHALAARYALADNFYLDFPTHDLNELTALGGQPSAYALRAVPLANGRAPLDDRGADPEDTPRSGYLFDALVRAGLDYRDYGGLMRLSGYRVVTTPAVPARRGHPGSPASATPLYTMNVPALAALGGHIDTAYAGFDPGVSDTARAAEFIADMGRLVANDAQPAYTYVWLPDTQGLADADRAVGQIVAFLSRTPHWSSTAVFIVGDGTGAARDHVNPARSFALVVSPLAKRGFIGHVHADPASVVKTEEELLGLPPLSLADLLASDMAGFFDNVPYPSAYQALP